MVLVDRDRLSTWSIWPKTLAALKAVKNRVDPDYAPGGIPGQGLGTALNIHVATGLPRKRASTKAVDICLGSVRRTDKFDAHPDSPARASCSRPRRLRSLRTRSACPLLYDAVLQPVARDPFARL